MTDAPLPAFRNPDTVAPPIGAYSHVAVVPPGAQVFAIAGQVGNDRDGTVPAEPERQYENALRNIVAILESEGAGPQHLIKLNTYLVRAMDLATVAGTRKAILGDVRPASTLVYVPRLAADQYLVEVEAWAIKPE
ncbi:RidA family protein [Sphingomonas sp. URHD0057]|uniref:RidA family protein n=1 Tax=Sphingomonas sp. URHD0057 TaxID=1380389 RepID=UPI000491A4D6|nr:RidA family protein [Sphingomonas sp. URHD0057]